jgi:hypothetical protein
MMNTIVMLNKGIAGGRTWKFNLVNNYSIHILDGSINFVHKKNFQFGAPP